MSGQLIRLPVNEQNLSNPRPDSAIAEEFDSELTAEETARSTWHKVIELAADPSKDVLPSWMRIIEFNCFLKSQNVVLITADTARIARVTEDSHKSTLFRLWLEAERILQVKKPVSSIVFCGLIAAEALLRTDRAAGGALLYKNRHDKSVDAKTYLLKYFGLELSAGSLTLSELKNRDKSLWQALRNWAHYGSHDLDEIILRGRSARHLSTTEIEAVTRQLEPSDPRDGLVLQALRVREQTRERVRRHRQKAVNLKK